MSKTDTMDGATPANEATVIWNCFTNSSKYEGSSKVLMSRAENITVAFTAVTSSVPGERVGGKGCWDGGAGNICCGVGGEGTGSGVGGVGMVGELDGVGTGEVGETEVSLATT